MIYGFPSPGTSIDAESSILLLRNSSSVRFRQKTGRTDFGSDNATSVRILF